jgi:hypothetical protein
MKNQYTENLLGVLPVKTGILKNVLKITGIQETMPVIPKAEKKPPVFREHPKYDEKYCREYEATITGVFFLVVPIMFMYFCVVNFVKYEGYNEFLEVLVVGGFVLRVIATLWVAKISRDQNRDSLRWIVFSLLLPGSALIILSKKKKYFDPSEWKKYLYNHNRTIPAAKANYVQNEMQLAS